MRSVILLAVMVACGAAAPASAQATFGQVRAEGSPVVYVTDRTGRETHGQLVTFSESEITVKTGALPNQPATLKTFTAAEVSLIERKGDSLKNGTSIGAVIGGLASALSVGEVCAGNGDHGCAGRGAAYILFGTAFYAAVGAGIDALIPGRTRIWPGKPAQAGAIGFEFSPRERRAFVGVRIRRR